jgi:hypothetical protein
MFMKQPILLDGDNTSQWLKFGSSTLDVAVAIGTLYHYKILLFK